MIARVSALALLALFAADSVAGIIENPATPPGGQKTVTLTETWRAGGDDDDVFFGSVQRVISGADGKVLVLDNQQAHVQVYSADGQWLQTLGREGEGPGEVRDPSDTFYVPDGRLVMAQEGPGKLVYLNSDGTPGGQTQYQPVGQSSAFVVLVGGRTAPSGMLLTGIRFNQSGPEAHQTFFLSGCDPEGAEETVYLEKTYTVNYADFRLDEAAMDFVWMGRMDIDPDGRVYVAPGRDIYAVKVHAPDGSLLREFGRPVSAPKRTAEETTIATKVQEAIGANYGVPLRGVTVEDKEPVIQAMWVRPNGEVWVRTPANERPEGAFALLDVFDADGRFTHQLALEMPGDPGRDGLHLMADGRIAVVIGGLDAWFSQQGVEMSSEDSPVLEVICYEAI